MNKFIKLIVFALFFIFPSAKSSSILIRPFESLDQIYFPTCSLQAELTLKNELTDYRSDAIGVGVDGGMLDFQIMFNKQFGSFYLGATGGIFLVSKGFLDGVLTPFHSLIGADNLIAPQNRLLIYIDSDHINSITDTKLIIDLPKPTIAYKFPRKGYQIYVYANIDIANGLLTRGFMQPNSKFTFGGGLDSQVFSFNLSRTQSLASTEISNLHTLNVNFKLPSRVNILLNYTATKFQTEPDYRHSLSIGFSLNGFSFQENLAELDSDIIMRKSFNSCN